MSLSAISLIVVGGLTLLGWKIFKRFVARSSLDNVPGPPKGSFLTGGCFSHLIHLSTNRVSSGPLQVILFSYTIAVKERTSAEVSLNSMEVYRCFRASSEYNRYP